MRKKNGFISMSIIYSFFTVFILVSTSLLLIYSNNLAIVKSVNKGIKNDLTNKGNRSLMIFKNLIQDGSFEKHEDYWTVDINNTSPDWESQNYYGNNSLGIVKDSANGQTGITYVQSKYAIYMIPGHYYYISRVYMAYNNFNGTSDTLSIYLTPDTASDFTIGAGAYDILANAKGKLPNSSECQENTLYNESASEELKKDCAYNARSIERDRIRYESGFCLSVNGRCNPDGTGENQASTFANTLESGVFKFAGNTSSSRYRVLVGANFNNYSFTNGVEPRYYTDGYMLVDLSVALQGVVNLEEEFKDLVGTEEINKRAALAEVIDSILDGKYIEGQRTIPVNKFNF